MYDDDDDEDDDDVDDDDDDDNDDDGDDDGVPALLPGCKPSPGYSRLRCCTCNTFRLDSKTGKDLDETFKTWKDLDEIWCVFVYHSFDRIFGILLTF